MKNNLKNLWTELKSVEEKEKEFYTISENVADIISKIVIERNKLNISQRDLAKMTGLKQSAIARMESLAVIPRIDTLIKICYHLNLNLELSTNAEIENRKSTIVILDSSDRDSKIYSIKNTSDYATPSYISESYGRGYPTCIS